MYDSIAAILFNEFSGWWIILCIILGLSYAAVFYRKNFNQRSILFYFLFVLRAIAITLLSFLLLSPLLETFNKRVQKPLIIIAQDNSESIKIAPAKGFNFDKYHEDLLLLKQNLNDYDVEVLGFGEKIIKDLSNNYTHQNTNISELFSYIKEQFYGKNIGSIIIASDGVFNKGTIPNNINLENKTPIYTIALGDTIPKKDLLIANVNYNKIVYLNNDYYININLEAFQSIGQNALLKISTSDKQNISQNIKINAQDWKEKIDIRLATKKKGIQKVTISVSPINGEITTDNNQQTIYVDVIDGREKILILANAPHPDLKAFKNSLDINKNYETDILLADKAPKDLEKYGLIILHNLPSQQYPVKEILDKTESKSKWYIIGTETNTNTIQQRQQQIYLSNLGIYQDQYASLNKSFKSFSLSENTQQFFQQLAPLNTSIGKASLKTSGNILLYKKNSEEPLLSFTEQNSIKTAFLIGDGIWRWRIDNYNKVENHDAFDDFINKTVQYLNVKDDKRKLRVYPAKDRFNNNESVLLNAEFYNDSYEVVSDAEISINIQHSSGKSYSYLFSKRERFYELNAGFLPEGEYDYTATTTYGNIKHESKGNFIVEKTNLELQQTTANHQALYNLSSISGGEMAYPNDILSLADHIKKNEKIKTITYQDKNYEELIDIKWIFFLLILLLSTEWFLRKRNGVI